MAKGSRQGVLMARTEKMVVFVLGIVLLLGLSVQIFIALVIKS